MAREKHKHETAHLPPPQERFINRELSWLAFNFRVLEEAQNHNNPLLERLNFLSISAANLDEFYMVRVAGLKAQAHHGLHATSDDGQTPLQQLQKIHKEAEKLMAEQQTCWKELRNKLNKAGVSVLVADELTQQMKRWLSDYFRENIFPALTPIAIDPAHPFPFLPNLGLAQVMQLSINHSGKQQIAVIPLPSNLPRFIKLPNKGRRLRFVLLEDVITLFLDMLFPGFKLVTSGLFRIVRDSDLDIEEDAEDLVRHFESAVKQRRRGRVIHIKMQQKMPENLRNFVIEHLHVEADDITEAEVLLGLSSVSELYDCDKPELRFTPFNVRFPERIIDYGGDCFAAIQAKDIIVHHPFESFDAVVQFLRQAAGDPDVVSIKQTLYRTSKDSPIVKALIEAAEAGKSVTALVELKARFDEEANIKWARDLERAGVQVIYGFVNLKTHAKVSLVVRRVEGKLKSYVHFGTGNYHPNTAKIYTDLSFFTSDPALCHDAAQLFNFLTGYAPPKALNKIIMAPLNLRSHLLSLIEEEVRHVQAGKPGVIWAKMNALVDPELIDALYTASRQGVHITLIIRGICCLRPGVPGLSENIVVKSIVGRFLEHSRIFCFGSGHGMPSGEAKIFISSADWMPRNFDARIEVMVPIENSTVHEQVMGQIMVANIHDERHSWLLQPDASYKRVVSDINGFSAHDYFIHNPSLSGRGKALKKNKAMLAKLYKLRKNPSKSD